MKTNSLVLNHSELKITEAPEPKEVLLPLWGIDRQRDRLKVKEGNEVVTGEPILPGVFSTVTGSIKGIEPLLLVNGARKTGNGNLMAVRIEVVEREEWDDSVKEDPHFLTRDPLELLERLNRANLGFCDDFAGIEGQKTVIVSAVDPDPFQWVSQQLLREEKDTILEGLHLMRHLTSARRVILAVPESLADLAADEALAEKWLVIHKVNSRYPNGLPEMIARAAAPLYQPDTPLFLTVEKVAASVKALKEGKSFVHKVVSVIDKEGAANFKTRIGTPLKNLLDLKACYIKDDDKVIIGGPMRGYTCFNTDLPVTDGIDSIFVQHAEEVAYYWNNQCMNCGKCVSVCPVNLDVNLICRYSEFSLFETCHEMGIMTCIECGLCAYHCPSGRSLVQLIRLAKNEKPASEEIG
jgi:electron transport complex protein RnfC